MKQYSGNVASVSARAAALAVAAILLVGTGTIAATPDVRLVDAAKRGDRQTVSQLLKKGVDVNSTEGDGATALHWAAYLDDDAMVVLLLRARANVNIPNDLGVTPLFLACSNGNGQIAAKLLTAGANPNMGTPSGQTPLMTAARSGSVEATKALVSHGANVNAAETARGQTALMWAAANRHASVVRALLEAGADIKARSRTSRVRVIVGGEGATEVETGGSTALFFAARSGDVESAKLLVKAGANVNETTPDRNSVLAFAAHSGHREFTRFLLESGADPNAEGGGYTALHAAVLRGDADLVKALLARGANQSARLKQGTPVNRDSKDYYFATDWIGATPFWLAARFAEVQIMGVLLAAGADPNVTLPDGTTALMAAAGQDSARLDRRERRRDPIEFEALAPSLERVALGAVRFVTEAGADVNAVNQAGNTAIHLAAISKTSSVVQWLADHGARLEMRNKRGQTPLSIASTKTRSQSDEGSIDTVMVELLRRLGATQ
jgi:ankyrin repeat protein